MSYFSGKMHTPVHEAVMRGSKMLSETLEKYSAEPHSIGGGTYKTPLMIACLKGDSKAAIELIENGANVHARDFSGMTPLLLAIQNGMIPLLVFFISNKEALKINLEREKNYAGFNALHISVVNERHDIVKFLLQNTNIDKDAKTLHGDTAETLVRSYEMLKILQNTTTPKK